MNMKARRKKKTKQDKEKREMMTWLVFKGSSLCLFCFLFQFTLVMSYGFRVAHEYETSVFFPFL